MSRKLKSKDLEKLIKLEKLINKYGRNKNDKKNNE